MADKAHADFTGDYAEGIEPLIDAMRAHATSPASALSVTPKRPAPYEARLLVDRGEDSRPRARWDAEDLDDTEPFALALPLGEADMDELRWYLETYVQFAGAGDRGQGRSASRSA